MDRPITEPKSCPPIPICKTLIQNTAPVQIVGHTIITELKSSPPVSIGNTIIQNTGIDRRTDQSQSSRAVPPSPSAIQFFIQNTGTDRRTDQSQSSRAVPTSPSAIQLYRTPVQIVGQTNHRAQELSPRLHLQDDNLEHWYRSSDRPITEPKSCPPVSIYKMIIQNTGTGRRTGQSQSSRAVHPSPSVRRYYRTPLQIVGQTNHKSCPPVSIHKMIIKNTGVQDRSSN